MTHDILCDVIFGSDELAVGTGVLDPGTKPIERTTRYIAVGLK